MIRGFVPFVLFVGFAANLFALDYATITTRYVGKKEPVVERVKLEKVSKDTYRLKVKTKFQNGIDRVFVTIPEFSAQKGDAGYFVLSDGRIGAFRSDKGSIRQRTNPLPLMGMKKGDTAVLAIFKRLKHEFSSNVVVENGIYTMSAEFGLNIGETPYDNIEIDFVELSGADANYSGMARAYRNFQLSRGAVVPLRERVKGNPHLAYSADTMFVKIRAHSLSARANAYKKRTGKSAYAYTEKVLRDLKKAGVDKADICYTDWNNYFRYPTLELAVSDGEADLKKLCKTAKTLGFQLFPHILQTEWFDSSPDFDVSQVAHRGNGRPDKMKQVAENMMYRACFKVVYEKFVRRDIMQLLEYGFDGNLHIDVNSCITPPHCLHPNHRCNSDQTSRYMGKIADLAQKSFGGFSSEGPFDHFAGRLDYALYISAYPAYYGRAHPLVDDIVPLWQIVYHGIILSNPFASTIDYNIDNKRTWEPTTSFTPVTRRLKLYEFGGRPTFYWGFNGENIQPLKRAFDEYQKYKYLQYEFMQEHKKIAPDVFLTRYADGSEIVTNYAKTPFKYKGKAVAGEDFALFKPKSK